MALPIKQVMSKALPAALGLSAACGAAHGERAQWTSPDLSQPAPPVAAAAEQARVWPPPPEPELILSMPTAGLRR